MKRCPAAICSVILTVAISLTLSPNAKAQSSQSGNLDFGADKALIIVGVVAVAAVVVAVVLVHNSHGKRAVTGCVRSDAQGLSITDEKNQKVYLLAPGASGAIASDRMTLQIIKIKSGKNAGPAGWQTIRAIKNFGACQP